MSEQTQSNSQQMIVIALVVIAVLLAALVGVIVYQQSQTAKLASVGATSSTTPAASTPQMPAASTNTAPTKFDVKTATKVPAGMTPVQLVTAYNEDVVAGKFDEAYKLLPLASKTTYGDPASYASQLKSYGITSYKIGAQTGSGDSVAIAAAQVTPQMPITYTWNFKKVSGQWYVESRVMGGTVQ